MPLADSELAAITDYVRWVEKFRKSQKFVALGYAVDFAGRKDPAARINEMTYLVQLPRSVCKAWGRKTSHPPRQIRACFAAEKSQLVIDACALFGLDALTTIVTTNWLNAAGVKSHNHTSQLLASYIERHHAKCRRAADEAVEEVDPDDYRDLIAQVCPPCYLAAILRERFSRTSRDRVTLESASPDLWELRDWLISSGLLVRANGPTSQPDRAFAPAGENRWMFDRALLWLVKVFVSECLWSFVSWFLGRFAAADKRTDGPDRRPHFIKIARRDMRGSGNFLLPFTTRGGGLTVMSFWDSAWPRAPQRLIAYDDTHAVGVARRAEVLKAYVDFTVSERWRRHAKEMEKFWRLRP